MSLTNIKDSSIDIKAKAIFFSFGNLCQPIHKVKARDEQRRKKKAFTCFKEQVLEWNSTQNDIFLLNQLNMILER